jgi:hypothetical protein
MKHKLTVKFILMLFAVSLSGLMLYRPALADPPVDAYADAVESTSGVVNSPGNAVGAPDGQAAQVTISGQNLTLDMGADEEGTADLIVYYSGINLGLTVSVDFLNANKQIIASAPLQLLQTGGTFTTTVSFPNTAQSYKSYRYVRLNNTTLGVFNIDAIQATAYRPDSDNDGMPDTWEIDHGLDPWGVTKSKAKIIKIIDITKPWLPNHISQLSGRF